MIFLLKLLSYSIKRSAMDAHSREVKMLQKCSRARRENVDSDILYSTGGNKCYR